MATASKSLTGFAYFVRAFSGNEFLCAHTFGVSRSMAKRSLSQMNFRLLEARKPPLAPLALCVVTISIDSVERQMYSGQPPVNDAFVAEGCE